MTARERPSSKRGNVTNSAPEPRKTSPFLVKFWGVRGTLPTPGHSTLRYGGNTSCVEALVGESGKPPVSLIFDAGSGLASLGDEALERGERVFHIFLSHVHYDHIIGLTRFSPLFRPDCQIHFYGQAKCGFSLKRIIRTFFSAPFFPVEFKNLPEPSRLHFHEVNGLSQLYVEGAKVEFIPLCHPQEALGFRLWDFERKLSIVYATDHEHGSMRDGLLEEFSRNTSLLLYDSTYTEAEYPAHRGWGHSTAEHGALFAKNANAGAYGIFHHDPMTSDDDLENLVLPEAKRIFTKSFLCAETQLVDIQKLVQDFEWKDAFLTHESHQPVPKVTKIRSSE